MDTEAEARDDTEVATAATTAGPVQIGVARSIAGQHPPVRGHDGECEHVVRRRPQLARCEADPPTEGEPAHTDRGAGTGRNGPAGLRQPRIDVDQRRPGSNGGALCLPVHRDAVERAEVEHEPVLHGRVARVAVPSRTSTDPDAVPSRPEDRLPHIGGAGGAQHGQRLHPVEALVERSVYARIRSAGAVDHGAVYEPRQLPKPRVACPHSRPGDGITGKHEAQRAEDERAPVHRRPTYLVAEYDPPSQMLTTGVKTAAAVLLVASGLVAAAGRSEASSSRITVFAASSLTDVFPKIDRRPRYSFASSSTLAQQIRQGAPADVFASADLRNPEELRSAELCSRHVVFATNALVVVYPRSNPGKVKTVFDLRRPGLKVVIAEQGVPIGDYTRTVLRKLGITRAVLANVVSQEPDVRGVLAKVTLGEADAGFVYRTDAATVGKRVGVIRLPTRAQPSVKYGICVVSASVNKADARAFITTVLGKTGRTRLTAAGFGVPAAKK